MKPRICLGAKAMAMLARLAASLTLVVCVARPARAYDPATTHAGLTQKAALASKLHQVLARRMARPLGLFDPVPFGLAALPDGPRRLLGARFRALDPAGGYRPSDAGVATALGWVMAGSVLAKTPPERIRNQFFDPSTKRGLADAAALDGFFYGVRQILDRGSVRDVATGTSFSFEGLPAIEWLRSPQNELGLVTFVAELERSVLAETAAQRNTALARALMALGGCLTLLEDAGNPAQVRNDFRAAYLRGPGGSPFDRASTYERFVADRYGVGGVPSSDTVVRRESLNAFFAAPDGQGLAERTQRRFFSEGTVPEEIVLERETTAADVVVAAQRSLTYALPAVASLDLRASDTRRYVTIHDGVGAAPGQSKQGRRALAYQRTLGSVRFFLDTAVYADTAAVLLPEIVGYAAGFIDHLLRADVAVTVAGPDVRAEIRGVTGSARSLRFRWVVERRGGHRHEIAPTEVTPTERPSGSSVSARIPAGAERVAVFVQGEDEGGPFVGVGEVRVGGAGSRER